MNDAADTLVIDAYGEIYGQANMSAGTLIVRGEMGRRARARPTAPS